MEGNEREGTGVRVSALTQNTRSRIFVVVIGPPLGEDRRGVDGIVALRRGLNGTGLEPG